MPGTQSNTLEGDLVFPAYSDLTGLSNRLVKLVSNGGVANVAPLASQTDVADYLLLTEGIAGQDVYVRPIQPNRTMRVVFFGNGNIGDKVSAADPGTPANAGMIQSSTNPTDGPIYGTLEEQAQNGQYARIRPHVGDRPKHYAKAVLVAGTVVVADTSITANSHVRAVRGTAGGTEGELSVVLNAGVGYTINSSNNADTSTVLVEVIN